MDVTLSAPNDFASFRREGANIALSTNFAAVSCGATQPTVNNTDRIVVNDASTGDNRVYVDLSGGPFAPGVENEIGGTDEIEIEAHMSAAGTQVDSVTLYGSKTGNDSWRLGQTPGGGGANLNAGSESGPVVGNDADLTYDGLTGSEKVFLLPEGGDDRALASGGDEFAGPLPTSTRVVGGEGDDVLAGGSGLDEISDGPGDDDVSGGAGPDFFDTPPSGNDDFAGGSGTDFIGYSPSPAMRIDLRLSAPQDTGGGGRDSFSGVENVTTGAGNDVLIGSDASNELSTSDGSDLVIGRGGDLDVLSGGSALGTDTLSYASPPAGVGQGVRVDLAIVNPTVQATGGAGADKISGFEHLVGSPFADTLFGDGAANTLEIRDGVRDSATCRGGSDTVTTDVPGVDSIAADCETRRFDFRPDTEITSGPSDFTRDATPTFAFRTTKAASTLQCSLDGGAFAACSSERTLGELPEGAHSFQVRARDMFGALDLSPALRAFTVDATRPRITRAKIAKRFRLDRRRTPVSARARRGASFRYRLSEAATVRIKIQRCRKLSKSRQCCRRYKTVKTLQRKGKKGSNRHRFSGRIRGTRARSGLFRAILTATDKAGNRSTPKQLKFKIVR